MYTGARLFPIEMLDPSTRNLHKRIVLDLYSDILLSKSYFYTCYQQLHSNESFNKSCIEFCTGADILRRKCRDRKYRNGYKSYSQLPLQVAVWISCTLMLLLLKTVVIIVNWVNLTSCSDVNLRERKMLNREPIQKEAWTSWCGKAEALAFTYLYWAHTMMHHQKLHLKWYIASRRFRPIYITMNRAS